MLPSLEEFRIARWAKGLNRTVQIGLSLTLVAGLNFLAARHFERWDLTAGHRHSLSAETRAYLTRAYLDKIPGGNRTAPVELTLTLPTSQPNKDEAAQIDAMLAEMRGLLAEYAYAAESAPGGPFPLKTDEVDTYKQSVKTEELMRHGLATDTVLLVRHGDQFRSLTVADLYETKNGVPTGFLGESAVTAAILDVIQAKPQKIYLTLGHGEMRLDDVSPQEGLTELKQALRERNFDPEELNLTVGGSVPDDAALVVVAGPQLPFQPYEVDKLRTYLNQPHGPDQINGRVIALLEPGESYGLDNLFYQWGIRSDDALVVDPSATVESPQGDIVIANYLDHKITRYLALNQLPVEFGPTRPVREDLTAPLDDRRQVSGDLLRTTKDSWAERGYQQGDMKYTKGVDLPGPVSVAALSEEQLLAGQPSQGALNLPVTGGRLVVFGNADFIANERFHIAGNSYLFLNTVNYLLDRQNVLNIPPKPPFQFSLDLSRDDLVGLAWRLALPPVILALLGFMAHLARRRQ